MQRIKQSSPFAALVFGILVLALWLWGFGGAADVTRWAASEQRAVQNSLAVALRALRAGDTWALLSLIALCFAYGVVHAAGPGHGKLLMGGYAVGTEVPRRRVVVLTLAGAIGQALTAIALVAVGAAIFGLGRTEMVNLADGYLSVVSAVAIALVGLWLVLRGVLRVGRIPPSETIPAGICPTCGHAHGPSPAEIKRATDWRSALAVVAAVAVRPCTGALFVLILTFSMGLTAAGILGVLAMALGTALVTLAVALGAWHFRGGLAARIDGPGGLRVLAGLEVLAGLTIALVSLQTAARLL